MADVDHALLTGTALHEDKRIKEPVRAASTANVSLSTPGATLDGVTLNSGDRLLLKDQSTASQCGIYIWTGSSSALTRASDADSASDFVYGFKTYVLEGTANGASYWNFTTVSAITLGSTSLAFGRESVSAAGEITGVDFKPTGMTGATAASRYVGATASGAPTTGAHVVGDFIVDQTGPLWVCTTAGTPGTWTRVGISPYACIQDQKTQNTAGGTFTSGADQTRTLNTVASDTTSMVSLSSNQFTIAAGTYRILARAPAVIVNAHQAFLYNITDSAVQNGTGGQALRGTSAYSDVTGGGANESIISGKFTITGTKAFEIRHRCQSTRATNGFGNAGNFGIEIYTTVELWKES